MRSCIIFLAIFAVTLASEIQINGFDLDKESADKFLLEYQEKLRSDDVDEITVVCNAYAEKLFFHIEKFALSHGLDPVKLNDVRQNFIGASINLTEGHLNGISTLNRYDDVKLTYQYSLKKLTMEFPITFSNLNFTNHYHVTWFWVGSKGGMTGRIHDFKVKISLSFDFNTYKAKLENMNTTDTGFISLTFDGHGLINELIELLSEFVFGILHPLLTATIEGIMKNVASIIVSDVNNFIDQILHPTSANITDTFIGNKYSVPAGEFY